MRLLALLPAAALLLIPKAVLACAVCFGNSETRIVQGLTWGLYLLLGCTFSILLILARAVWRIEKNRESLALKGGHGRT